MNTSTQALASRAPLASVGIGPITPFEDYASRPVRLQREPVQGTCACVQDHMSSVMRITIKRRHSAARVTSDIQFTSQVFPPSTENACSKCAELAVMLDQT